MSNINKEESTSFRDNIIKRKLNDAIASLIDGMNYYLGLGFLDPFGPISALEENKEISKTMTNMFTNTTIHVYTWRSKTPNAFTAPTFLVSADIFKYIYTGVNFLPFNIGKFLANIVINFMNAIMYFRKFMYGINYEQANSLTYNPKNKKFTITVPYITCYISTGLIELLDNNDEVIAVLLHEVGHNTQIFLSIMDSILKVSIAGLTIDIILAALFENKVDVILEKLFKRLPFLNNSVLMLITLLIVLTYINNYFRKRNEIYADEFAIKCGYGEAISSAITKLHNYSRTPLLNNSFKKLSMNLFDKGVHFIGSIKRLFAEIIYMMNIGGYPSMNDRERYIEEKTKSFNQDMINKTDRSEHFDNRILI